MDYRRTALNGELEGKKFKYGDLKLEYKEEDIVSIKLFAYEGYSHRVITFSNSLHLYFRETNTQMYYFITDTLVGDMYKVEYTKESNSDTNFFNREKVKLELIDVDYYIEFSNEACDGYGFMSSSKKKVFIPSLDRNEMVVLDLEEISTSFTSIIDLEDFKCFAKESLSNYEDGERFIRNVNATKEEVNDKKLLGAYRFNNSYYFEFEGVTPFKIQQLSNLCFLSKTKSIPIGANTIYKAYQCKKRTNGVSDVIKGAFDYFSW